MLAGPGWCCKDICARFDRDQVQPVETRPMNQAIFAVAEWHRPDTESILKKLFSPTTVGAWGGNGIIHER